MDIINAALPVVFIIVGIALVWFVVELAITVRKARTTIDDLKSQVDPIIANANELTESAKPAIAKVDPLVDRVQLTVDAANLEIMRVDQILEDVTQITDTVSTATVAVDKVAQAPVTAVENLSNRIRDAFKPRRASNVSRALGGQKEAASAEAASVEAEVEVSESAPEKPAHEPAHAAEEADGARD